jgi:hypothetical protein
VISLFDACIPPCLRAMTSLDTILAKAEAHCDAANIDPAALLGARLYPDMFPLTRQVQTAADAAKLAGFRLAGLEAPKHADTESSFGELRGRLAAVIDLLGGLAPAQFEGGETRDITVPTRKVTLHFTGQEYLQVFALPNMYFHVTTAYAILRHNGVVIGKRDYLGPMPG